MRRPQPTASTSYAEVAYESAFTPRTLPLEDWTPDLIEDAEVIWSSYLSELLHETPDLPEDWVARCIPTYPLDPPSPLSSERPARPLELAQLYQDLLQRVEEEKHLQAEAARQRALEEKRVLRENIAKLEAEYRLLLGSWEAGRAAFEAAESEYQTSLARFTEPAEAERRSLNEAVASAPTGDSVGIERLAQLVLAIQEYPDIFPRSARIHYLADQQTLHVEYRLPDLASVAIVRPTGKYLEDFRRVSQKDCKEGMDDALSGIACRSLIALARALRPSTVSSLHFLGWVRTLDPATGRDHDIPICSVLATTEQLLAIDPKRAVARDMFRSLKGMAARHLGDYVPVRPVLALSLTDDRFIEGRRVIDSPRLDNLAMMDWDDFEHLVRELFEREFASSGGEVKVTRASHDRGVDAVAFDPDPIRGGKFIIQAKRYTAAVDVAAVRELYGAVQNERANRGILITTSYFGTDAYHFAKDKNLTLLGGNELLGLLEKHGYKFRIDLREARTKLGLAPRE